mmetsp:Transcript_78226/g.221209  ORF Transcript_78226/g.221209 Transcript_78226/m.221209 type:complete len:260 (+) Transcript_78226:1571-2350(+)
MLYHPRPAGLFSGAFHLQSSGRDLNLSARGHVAVRGCPMVLLGPRGNAGGQDGVRGARRAPRGPGADVRAVHRHRPGHRSLRAKLPPAPGSRNAAQGGMANRHQCALHRCHRPSLRTHRPRADQACLGRPQADGRAAQGAGGGAPPRFLLRAAGRHRGRAPGARGLARGRPAGAGPAHPHAGGALGRQQGHAAGAAAAELQARHLGAAAGGAGEAARRWTLTPGTTHRGTRSGTQDGVQGFRVQRHPHAVPADGVLGGS